MQLLYITQSDIKWLCQITVVALCLQLRKSKILGWGATMKLTRREILEQLGRLGINGICDLKKACREFEAYWDCVRFRY